MQTIHFQVEDNLYNEMIKKGINITLTIDILLARFIL